jgi:hypothetical protein
MAERCQLVPRAGEGLRIDLKRWGKTRVLAHWFQHYTLAMEDIPEFLRYNGDEVGVVIRDSGKLVCLPECRLFRLRCKKLPHITVFPVFNCFADSRPPFVVLPMVVNVKARCAKIHPAALFLDNAPIRSNIEAMPVFRQHNVRVFLFPRRETRARYAIGHAHSPRIPPARPTPCCTIPCTLRYFGTIPSVHEERDMGRGLNRTPRALRGDSRKGDAFARAVPRLHPWDTKSRWDLACAACGLHLSFFFLKRPTGCCSPRALSHQRDRPPAANGAVSRNGTIGSPFLPCSVLCQVASIESCSPIGVPDCRCGSADHLRRAARPSRVAKCHLSISLNLPRKREVARDYAIAHVHRGLLLLPRDPSKPLASLPVRPASRLPFPKSSPIPQTPSEFPSRIHSLMAQ